MQPSTILFESLTLGEKFSTGIITMVLGMLVVFTVLLIIMLILQIIGAAFAAKDKKAAAKKDQAAEETPAPVAVPAEDVATENEEEIVAAITAAIAVMTEAPVGSFRVVSFKKTTAKAAWNKK